jgi:molybdenum cofactor biosynthesis enzyme MoaA
MPPLQEIEIRTQAEAEARYGEYLAYVEDAYSRAERGEFHLAPPAILWVAITENCNLKCVGCYTEGLFKKVYIDVADMRRLLSSVGSGFECISLTEGEAFLHPKLCDIIEICKEHHPDADVWVISNGTIPIKGRYRRAVSLIDRLGLSIDGATKATYEGIRVGANFERFIENVREIVAIRKETGFPRHLGFSFTATRTNLPELAGVVRLAHALGVPLVWAQPMEIKNEEVGRRIAAIHIDTMPKPEIRRLMEEAQAEAKRLGVQFHSAVALWPDEEEVTDKTGSEDLSDGFAAVRQEIVDELAVRMCQYTWREDFQFLKVGEAFQIVPCCYMDRSAAGILAKRYGFSYDQLPTSDALFNSAEFWRFRRDLALGKMGDVCGMCQAAKTYPWEPGNGA